TSRPRCRKRCSGRCGDGRTARSPLSSEAGPAARAVRQRARPRPARMEGDSRHGTPPALRCRRHGARHGNHAAPRAFEDPGRRLSMRLTFLMRSWICFDAHQRRAARHGYRAGMTPNEGVLDRVVRITAGFLLLSAFFLVDGNLKWLTLIGVAPLVTGLFGWCP